MSRSRPSWTHSRSQRREASSENVTKLQETNEAQTAISAKTAAIFVDAKKREVIVSEM